MKDVKINSELIWVDEKGIGPMEQVTVTKILYEGKTPSAYEVSRGEKPAAVFRAVDCLCVDDLPPGLILFLKKIGGFGGRPSSIPSTHVGVDEGHDDTTKVPGGSMWVGTEVQGVPEGFDWSKVIGQPYHDINRNRIGTIVRAGQGKVIVRINAGQEEEAKALIASGQWPGAEERPEPKAGDNL